ncbi:integrase core domain-containing protein [Pirellulaceae bacterium]|nr:integrase core domain-containing protein [Pirellulaceae bacterium]
MLRFIYECSREFLAIDMGRKLNNENVPERLSELFCSGQILTSIHSDSVSKLTCHPVQTCLKQIQVKTSFIEPGSLWENGAIEPFNGEMRDKLNNLEIFDTMLEGNVLIERWRRHYNQVRPHKLMGLPPSGPRSDLASKKFENFCCA